MYELNSICIHLILFLESPLLLSIWFKLRKRKISLLNVRKRFPDLSRRSVTEVASPHHLFFRLQTLKRRMEKTDGTMKAAVVEHACDPADHPCKIENVSHLFCPFLIMFNSHKARYQQVEIPEPKSGEVLIKMLAVDVCRNDICCIAGEWAEATKFPLIPGHEGVGVIEKLGENVQHLHVGDRVGTAWMHCGCLACKYCGTGRENACPCHKSYGIDAPGTMAQYAVAQANFLVKIPDNLSDEEAASKN